MGMDGSTAAARSILDGTFLCPPEVDDYTKKFISSLRSPPNLPPPKALSISAADFQSYWRRARERTSSSYSGLHFGHYKAAASCPTLSELHAIFTQLCFANGFSPQRWQSGLQVVLEKKAGVIHIDKLRALLLMEADFNFGNKILFGYRMMLQAQDSQAIPDECFGSVKGRRAIHVSLSSCLLTDIARQRRAPLALVRADVAGCYDNIAHPPASIACQRLGASSECLSTMFQTLRLMKFFLRTAYGDSPNFYGGGLDILPFQGVCQGNGAGPAVWLALSICLIHMLHTFGHSSTISSAITLTTLALSGLLYVDDSDLFILADSPLESPVSVIQKLQTNVQLWQGGLHATGGSLAADKCSWSLLAFQWKNGKWKLHTQASYPASLLMLDPSGHPTALRRCEPTEASKAVGIFQSLSGSMVAQYTHLCQQADSIADAFATGYLPRNTAWLGLTSMLWPSLSYSLPVTSFSEPQCLQITRKLYRGLLPKLGVVRSFPLSLRHAPSSLYGLALPSIFWEQGIAALHILLECGNGPSVAGSLLRTSVEQAQLEVGSLTPFYQLPFQQYGFLLSNCWLKSVWNFLSSAQLCLQSSSGSSLHLQRIHDTFLMDHLVSTAAFTPATLQSFNRCRLYMRCLSLADISTGKGDHLHPPFYTRFSPQPPSHFLWPAEHPSASDWATWESLLLQVFCSSGNHLLSPLGNWLHPPYRISSFVRYDPLDETLYIPGNAGVWRSYLHSYILPSTSHRRCFSQHSVSPHPPPISASHWMLVDHIGLGPLFAFGSAPGPPFHHPPWTCSRSWRIWVLVTGLYNSRASPPMEHTWPWLSSLAMPMGSVMGPICRVSVVTWVLLHGSWRTVAVRAYIRAMDPFTVLVALVSPTLTGLSSKVCTLCSWQCIPSARPSPSLLVK